MSRHAEQRILDDPLRCQRLRTAEIKLAKTGIPRLRLALDGFIIALDRILGLRNTFGARCTWAKGVIRPLKSEEPSENYQWYAEAFRNGL